MLPANLLAISWCATMCFPLASALCAFSSKCWQIAGWLIGSGLTISALSLLETLLFSHDGVGISFLLIKPVNGCLLLLINLLAFVVMRYARTNFSGDSNGNRFLRWLMLTVFAVMVTVGSNHLLIFWVGWVGISLSLHKLLMFYPSRPRAALAAHKKFILARIAEILLASAFCLLYFIHGSLFISDILSQYPTNVFGWPQQTVAVLLAMVALIKCAQLPLHGWLIQVVESPTPVSGLLHAGVINMGGFLLIAFAPLLNQSCFARWLILIVSGLSTVLSALIMMTRISVKVKLAWSTTAQMGLMLLECALGLYPLAFLHLLAHSCYKAHAFLNAGNEVNASLKRQLVGLPVAGFNVWLAAALTSSALTAAAIMLFRANPPFSPWFLVVIALAQLLSFYFNNVTRFSVIDGLTTAVILLGSYLLAKAGSDFLLAGMANTYNDYADCWLGLLFISLLAIYLTLQYHPDAPFARRLFIALNAGFYLDERVTRLTLKCWPLDLPKTPKTSISYQPETV